MESSTSQLKFERFPALTPAACPLVLCVCVCVVVLLLLVGWLIWFFIHLMSLLLRCGITCIVWVLVSCCPDMNLSPPGFHIIRAQPFYRSAWGPGKLLLENQKLCLGFCHGVHCVLEIIHTNWGQLAMNSAINSGLY